MNLKLQLIFLVLFISGTTFSQTLSRSNLSTAGGIVANDSGINLSWTIGEVFSETIQNEVHVTGGFQQGELSTKNQSQKENIVEAFEANSKEDSLEKATEKSFPVSTSQENFQVIVFPNPTLKDLWIKSNSEDSQDLILKVLDTSGRTVLQQTITLENFQKERIDKVDSLNSGNYILSLSNNGGIVSSQRFVKI